MKNGNGDTGKRCNSLKPDDLGEIKLQKHFTGQAEDSEISGQRTEYPGDFPSNFGSDNFYSFGGFIVSFLFFLVLAVSSSSLIGFGLLIFDYI